MRIKYVGSQNFILVFALWMLLCWVFGASAAEKWDAKTTARINLRKNPSSKGVILSIVPNDHRVRIMDIQGLWCKIDVEGDIHGKGWVYAEYLEEILPKVPAAETNLQTAAVELPSGDRVERIHPANLSPSVRTLAEKQRPLHTPPPEKASRVDVREQPSIHEEFPPGRNKSGSLSGVKISTAVEPSHTVPAQVSPEVRAEDEKERPLGATKSEKAPITGNKHYPSTQNEWLDIQPKSAAASPLESPIIGKPIYVAPIQPQQPGIKSHPSGVIKKAFSDKRKGPIAKQVSMGLVELTLKLMSIALTALVILFLHRANKIAASHYEALMQFQNKLNSRQ
jgi:hypothetical protein